MLLADCQTPTGYMDRAAYQFWFGKTPPADAARFELYGAEVRTVTWKKVHDARRDRQKRILDCIRHSSKRSVPGYVWVFYNKGWLYGGWWLYIRTLHESIPLNFRDRKVQLIEQAMRLFPAGVFPSHEYLKAWMPAFADAYPNRYQRQRKEGIALCRVFFDQSGYVEAIGSWNEFPRLTGGR